MSKEKPFKCVRRTLASTAVVTFLTMSVPAQGFTNEAQELPPEDARMRAGNANPVLTEIANPLAKSNGQSNTGTKRTPKVALALGGGGTRGAAHIGVLRVLQKNGIPIDMIAGTSMGAIVGGLYAAGVDVDTLQEKFDDESLMKSFMTVPLTVRMIVAPIMILPRAFGHHAYDGLYKGGKFRKYIKRSVTDIDQNIEGLKIQFAAVALDVVDGKPHRLTKGDLGYALQASSAVPGLRKPVQIGEQLFVDGGVVENVPVDEARAMGGDIVIAVDVDERFAPVPLDTFRAMGSISKRMLKLQLANVDAPQVKNADIVIHPMVDGIGLISTKAKDANQAILAGEKAAQEALPAIKAKLAEAGIVLTAPSKD